MSEDGAPTELPNPIRMRFYNDAAPTGAACKRPGLTTKLRQERFMAFQLLKAFPVPVPKPNKQANRWKHAEETQNHRDPRRRRPGGRLGDCGVATRQG